MDVPSRTIVGGLLVVVGKTRWPLVLVKGKVVLCPVFWHRSPKFRTSREQLESASEKYSCVALNGNTEEMGRMICLVPGACGRLRGIKDCWCREREVE